MVWVRIDARVGNDVLIIVCFHHNPNVQLQTSECSLRRLKRARCITHYAIVSFRSLTLIVIISRHYFAYLPLRTQYLSINKTL